jgi:hypothetical protein
VQGLATCAFDGSLEVKQGCCSTDCATQMKQVCTWAPLSMLLIAGSAVAGRSRDPVPYWVAFPCERVTNSWGLSYTCMVANHQRGALCQQALHRAGSRVCTGHL